MAYYGESDIAAALAGPLGKVIAIGAASTNCWLNITDQEIYPGGTAAMAGKLIKATILTGSLSGLAVNATAVADGTSYKVVDYAQMEDGAVTEITLASFLQ